MSKIGLMKMGFAALFLSVVCSQTATASAVQTPWCVGIAIDKEANMEFIEIPKFEVDPNVDGAFKTSASSTDINVKIYFFNNWLYMEFYDQAEVKNGSWGFISHTSAALKDSEVEGSARALNKNRLLIKCVLR